MNGKEVYKRRNKLWTKFFNTEERMQQQGNALWLYPGYEERMERLGRLIVEQRKLGRWCKSWISYARHMEMDDQNGVKIGNKILPDFVELEVHN